MELLLSALSGVVTAYGAVYLIAGIAMRRLFTDVFQIEVRGQRSLSKWNSWLRVGLATIGLGSFFYFGSYGIFQFIPDDFGALDEDGDWQGVRDSMRALFAVSATLLVISKLEEARDDR